MILLALPSPTTDIDMYWVPAVKRVTEIRSGDSLDGTKQ